MKFSVAMLAFTLSTAAAFSPSAFNGKALTGPKSTSALDMKYKVAVVGGGPSGACAAEIFAQEKNIDTVLFERKMDNAKPCGGAIPLCMVGEFDLPESVVDRKVRVLGVLRITDPQSRRHACATLCDFLRLALSSASFGESSDHSMEGRDSILTEHDATKIHLSFDVEAYVTRTISTRE